MTQMNENRKKAWDCLTDAERQSIYLTLGQGLSGCEAGEILGMTHYKYLELKGRSETFFKLLSDYFEIHKSLIRGAAPITPAFRDYLFGCIAKRLNPLEASTYAGDNQWSLVRVRTEEIIKGMKSLRESDHPWDNDLYKLVQEFDRWNNQRILPNELQAPSPYKRKSNRQAKSYFKYLRKINPNTILKLSKTLLYKGKKAIYLPLISEQFQDGYLVIPIQNTKGQVDDLTIKRFYVFEQKVDAIEFCLMVVRQPNVLTPRDGQVFWKDYSEIIQKALNYESIDHTTKVRDFYDKEFKESYTRQSAKLRKKK